MVHQAMEIKYQTLLNDNPEIKSQSTDYVNRLQPISMAEIITLENTFNSGQPFPAALRELLYLAGKRCYVLDYSTYESQMEFQTDARTWLTIYGRNFSISRPYFVIESYSPEDNFVFVFVDANVANPIVYVADFEFHNEADPWPNSTGFTLTEFINQRIAKLKSGYNPF